MSVGTEVCRCSWGNDIYRQVGRLTCTSIGSGCGGRKTRKWVWWMERGGEQGGRKYEKGWTVAMGVGEKGGGGGGQERQKTGGLGTRT